MLLAISHSPEIGTVLEGAQRSASIRDLLQDCGWCWDRTLDCWALPGSRGYNVSVGIITCTIGALTRRGHEVITAISTQPRDETRCSARPELSVTHP